MNKRTFLALAVFVLFAPLISFAAWSDPSLTPPNGNSSEPLNTGGSAQSKSGGVVLNTGGATNGLLVQYGNTGIGNVSPEDKLHVGGNVLVDGYKSFIARYTSNNNYRGHYSWDHLQLGNNGNNYIVAGNTGAGGSLRFIVNNTNDLTGLYADSNYNGTLAMSIGSNGNTAIGLAPQDQKLTVAGNIKLTTSGGTNLGYVYSDGSNFGLLNNAGNWVMYAPNGATNTVFTGQATIPSLTFSGVGGNSGQAAPGNDYRIYQAPGAWSFPYPDLNIAWHTGVSIGASYSYGGTRFYNNSDMATELMSIGNGDNNVRVANTLYAPTFCLNGDCKSAWPSGITAEADTFNTVTARGATSNQGIQVNGNILACTSGSCSYLRYTGDNNNYLRGNTYFNGSLIDEDNGSFYVNPTGNTQLQEVYANGWVRNNNSGTGIYNQTNGKHFYSESASYWTMDSSNGMVLRNGHAGTITGYLYWDGTAGSNNFGLLSPNGSWGVRTYNGGVQLYGDVNAPYIRDSNDGGFYVDPNSVSLLNDVRGSIFYDRDNTGYYVNPADNSNLYYLNMATGGQSNGTFYITSGALWVQNTATAYFDGNLWVRGATNGGTGVVYIGDNPSNPNGSLTLYGSGSYQGTWTAASDRRLKTNIVALPNALEKIKQISGVSFDWKSTGKHTIGLIAQDVEKVYPELVSTDEKTGMKSVEYQNLVAPLIEAIKEQQKQIETLQAQVKALQK